ncbi:MAG TPA: hypothetical protein VKA19_07210 [Alphaproteobacteria bacterium]|nr:hypothetical protein [Alphaproteobacteria bacterium]
MNGADAYFRKQQARVRDAAKKLTEAAALLKKAKVDDLPEDLEDAAASLNALVEHIEEKRQAGNVVRLSDYETS